MSIIPYDKRKELTTGIEPQQLSIFTKKGIKQRDISDGRVSIRRLKINKAVNQDIKDLEDKISYLQESILGLNSQIKQRDLTIKEFETLFKKNTKRINEVKILEDFRDIFILSCMIKTGTPITILQCSGIVKRKECNFHDKCIQRIKILEHIL